MAKKIQAPDKFKWFTERSIVREKYELTKWQSAQLRAKTQRGVVWNQVERGGIIAWNWTILQSVLLTGVDSPETLALVEEYISTLPQSA